MEVDITTSLIAFAPQLHAMAFIVMLVFVIYSVRLYRVKPAGMWNVAMVICLFAFTLRVLTSDAAPTLARIFNSFEYLTPVFFMICVQVNFDDDFVFGKVEKTALGVVGSLAFLFAIHPWIGTSSQMLSFQIRSQFVIDGAAVMWTYWCVIRTWSADLDPYRRIARVFFVTGCGPVVAIVLTLYFISVDQGFTFSQWVDMFVSSAIVVLGLIGLAFFTEVKHGLFGQALPSALTPHELGPSQSDTGDAVVPDVMPAGTEPVPDAESACDHDFLQKLQQVMVGQQRFQEMGITLASLAQYMGTPEYRLRHVINRDLGYRNFNAYVNHYRIHHAKALLEDAGCSKSILDISMDCGYKSLSTFNKAFKDITSLTPSEYRKKRSPKE